ncbi:hypothetical protein ILP92_14410 [Maribius pontilimi]|uniref:Uncharacterized protein n=1 Tax=Palleronia pontilimi TaxID=1964209 RepID=A0A934IGG4_9RHOB|nr:hypothetical protein [Palleronia pontilimi]MBJ3763942.1 hypothetical protein [Palleronia pontilimi]
MKNEWFLDVLTDLKSFAEANDLCAVAAKLDEVQMTALAELLGADEARASGSQVSYETAGSGTIH